MRGAAEIMAPAAPLQRLSDLGEKALIREVIRPLLNPERDQNGVGDDCALICVPPGHVVCASTDRVPADLISFRLGLIDYRGLGNYLAVLNLSDLAAMGAAPAALLLNLGLPADLAVADLRAFIEGARAACESAGCRILGGDLSSAPEISISATSMGTADPTRVVRRSGASVGDYVYCSGPLGLTPTAFAYFLRAKEAGLSLSEDDLSLLLDCFQDPKPQFAAAFTLANCPHRTTAMDNTDGVAQSLAELSEASEVGFQIFERDLPIHSVSRRVAEFLKQDILDLVLGPGADFQLIGTIEPAAFNSSAVAAVVHPVGEVVPGPGVSIRSNTGAIAALQVRGWDYYSAAAEGLSVPPSASNP
jgi:thiamine-monophosphate kinase